MTPYYCRAEKFIAKFFPFISDCKDIDDYRDAVGYFNMIYHRNVVFHYGATRMAFVSSDYVIKMNRTDEEALDFMDEFGECERELRLYIAAKNDKFDYLFAEVIKFIYKDVAFYIMPRVHSIGRTYNNAYIYMTHEEDEWCNNMGLGDLHFNNYGWVDGHIRIFDYAANDLYE